MRLMNINKVSRTFIFVWEKTTLQVMANENPGELGVNKAIVNLKSYKN